jgi:alpha-glucosidase
MPWSRPESWDTALFESYRELIALRRGSPALTCGGLRWAAVGRDALAWIREHGDERLLCLAARSPHEPVRLPLRAAETLLGGDIASDNGEAVLPGDGPAFHVWRLED